MTLQITDPKTGKVIAQSGVLEDVFILPDENSNSLLILGPGEDAWICSTR